MLDVSTWQALTGGLLIGLAASLLILLSGKIAGISGILSGALFNTGDRGWRIAFIAGLVGGGILCHWLTGKPVPDLVYNNYGLAIAAGLLVGYGVRMGSGCTSGHGVCGLARFSKRSVVATLCFMGSGIITVALVNMLTGGAL